MKTRAKMSVQSGGSNNAEDNSFARATPSGGMNLRIDNPDVRGKFKPGQMVYVDITPIEEPAKA